MELFSRAPMPSRFVCFGASGTSVHVTLDTRHQAGPTIEFLGYVADVSDDQPAPVLDAPLWSFDDLLEMDDVGVLVSVFDPTGRRSVFERLDAAAIPIIGTRGLPHLSHPAADLGEGSVVPSFTRIGHTTVLGRGVLAFADLVAHDTVVGDFTTLASHCIVLGHVIIGNGVTIGTGAIINNGTAARPIRIGDGAVVGSGAVVDRDVEAGGVVVGPRGMPMQEWAALRALASDRSSWR